MRKQLGKDEKEALAARIAATFSVTDLLTKKSNVELIDEDGVRRLIVDGVLMFAYCGDILVPTLKSLMIRQILPIVAVDMGAVKFVTSGADVMRPGIKTIPPGLAKDALVCVVDEKHNKPLAVGQMLMDSEDATKATSGKTIKNLHWVGDPVWKL